jgi:hypothetical protein
MITIPRLSKKNRFPALCARSATVACDFLEAHSLSDWIPIADFTVAELRDLYMWIDEKFHRRPRIATSEFDGSPCHQNSG